MTRIHDRRAPAVHAGLALTLTVLLVAGGAGDLAAAPAERPGASHDFWLTMQGGPGASRPSGVAVSGPLIDRKAAAMSRACRWLAAQQAADGSLASPGQHLNVNVWETALSLVALLRCDRAAHAAVVPGGDRGKAERGLAWLAARQKPEGDWGAFPDYFWTPYYATAPIVTAFAAWGRRDDPVVARAVRFVRERQNPDGSWGDAGVPGTTSREFWTTLALSTLQASGDRAPRDVVDWGMTYLLDRQQPDGRWIGGRFKSVLVEDTEKKEDLSLTTLVIGLLSHGVAW